MIFFKILGSVIVICSCGLIGVYYSNELSTRFKLLKEFKRYMILLQGDIRYANTPLPEAMEKLKRRCEGCFLKFFSELSQQISVYSGETFYEIWTKVVDKHLSKVSLSKKDIAMILSLGETIGYLDKEMQMNTFELYLSQLDSEINELRNSLKQKTKLYNCMGIMAGLFLAIVLL